MSNSPEISDLKERNFQCLLESVSQLKSFWSIETLEAEKNRTLSKQAVERLKTHGFMDILLPRSKGGLGLDWQAVVEVGRLTARYCPSTAWMITLVGAHKGMVSRLPTSLVEEVATPKSIIATCTNTRDGKIIERSDSYILQGTWHYCSGIDHADYILVTAPLDSHFVKNGINKYIALIPNKDLTIEDNWFVTGLSATGSKDIVFRNYRIESKHLFYRPDYFDCAENSPCDFFGTEEVLPITTSLIIGPMLGCLEGGVKEAIAQLNNVISRELAEKYSLLERTIFAANQVDILQAEYSYIIDYLTKRTGFKRTLTAEEYFWLMTKKALFAKACVATFQPLMEALGTRAISKNNKVQMFWRDLQAMATHMDVKWTRSIGMADALLRGTKLDNLLPIYEPR